MVAVSGRNTEGRLGEERAGAGSGDVSERTVGSIIVDEGPDARVVGRGGRVRRLMFRPHVSRRMTKLGGDGCHGGLISPCHIRSPF